MSEYWKSAPRFWCKQCKIFIRDTPFEKSQHEASGKHQGNLKRFLRDIHRENDRQQRETQKAKNEVERLKQTVAGTPVGKSGNAPPWKQAPAAPTPVQRPISVEERKKQMVQLAEMGVAIPQEFRGDMALAGEWQTVSERVVGSDDAEGEKSKSIGVRKRKFEGDEEEQEAKREAETFVSKGWGSRTRQYPGAHDDTDLDALLDSTKDIKKSKTSALDAPTMESGKEALDIPAKKEGDAAVPELDQTLRVKEEETAEPDMPTAKNESEEAATGVVFKKRKAKVLRR